MIHRLMFGFNNRQFQRIKKSRSKSVDFKKTNETSIAGSNALDEDDKIPIILIFLLVCLR